MLDSPSLKRSSCHLEYHIFPSFFSLCSDSMEELGEGFEFHWRNYDDWAPGSLKFLVWKRIANDGISLSVEFHR